MKHISEVLEEFVGLVGFYDDDMDAYFALMGEWPWPEPDDDDDAWRQCWPEVDRCAP